MTTEFLLGLFYLWEMGKEKQTMNRHELHGGAEFRTFREMGQQAGGASIAVKKG